MDVNKAYEFLKSNNKSFIKLTQQQKSLSYIFYKNNHTRNENNNNNKDEMAQRCLLNKIN